MKLGGFPKLGVPFEGPYKKDYSILGFILRHLLFSQVQTSEATCRDRSMPLVDMYDPKGPRTQIIGL